MVMMLVIINYNWFQLT